MVAAVEGRRRRTDCRGKDYGGSCGGRMRCVA